jgi:hypothetical protein
MPHALCAQCKVLLMLQLLLVFYRLQMTQYWVVGVLRHSRFTAWFNTNSASFFCDVDPLEGFYRSLLMFSCDISMMPRLWYKVFIIIGIQMIKLDSITRMLQNGHRLFRLYSKRYKIMSPPIHKQKEYAMRQIVAASFV